MSDHVPAFDRDGEPIIYRGSALPGHEADTSSSLAGTGSDTTELDELVAKARAAIARGDTTPLTDAAFAMHDEIVDLRVQIASLTAERDDARIALEDANHEIDTLKGEAIIDRHTIAGLAEQRIAARSEFERFRATVAALKTCGCGRELSRGLCHICDNDE